VRRGTRGSGPTVPVTGKARSGCAPGTLYVVATPLGNMEDFTYRAARVLGEVDLVVAEDTRHTGKLLAHYGIRTRLRSYHEHNETLRTPAVIGKLEQGLSVALVCDAGTPCVSDPGYRLVKEATHRGFPVVPVPGACAAVAALSVGGLPTDTFLFVGFLPRKGGKRAAWLSRLAHERASLVFYESPRRIVGLVRDLLSVLGDREAALARELTKVHEEILRGNLSHILSECEGREKTRGECTLLVAGCGERHADSRSALHEGGDDGREDVPLPVLAARLARQMGISRKRAYQTALALKEAERGPDRED